MNEDVELEAIVIEKDDRYRDPLDAVGRRCVAAYDGIGVCHRRFDHAELGDPWHHAMTDAQDMGKGAQYWRWKKTEV